MKLSKHEFDEIIKNNLIDLGESKQSFGYKTDRILPYPDYYTKQKFKKFVEHMKKNYSRHYDKFYGVQNVQDNKGGKGGELAEKKGRWGIMPPKMASVASSSRFCYLALRDGTDALGINRTLTKDDVEFEKECKIFEDGLTAPQLDAYIRDFECDNYVEAKCHEIFDSHKIEFKNKYWDVFQKNSFSVLLGQAYKDKETFELPRAAFDLAKNQKRFDVKQFVCHLLGIANQSQGRNARLIYLFFKPICENEEVSKKIDEVFDELQKEITAIFCSKVIQDFCKINQIELMAITETSKVMQKLTKDNMEKLF